MDHVKSRDHAAPGTVLWFRKSLTLGAVTISPRPQTSALLHASIYRRIGSWTLPHDEQWKQISFATEATPRAFRKRIVCGVYTRSCSKLPQAPDS
jgi:hypothetical protein